ncbi:type II site-specific deoxyribonuclease [methanotrophic bacterial endosymbiont of Bathymodiolus sp.]|nr:type II site-specific deoxyribonuclease [methanotrophic bacterial endosymbiont of Bathymodiolus sp.]
MTNILEAIVNIANLPNLSVKKLTFGNNRATNVGDGLEEFIKDVFSGNNTVSDYAVKDSNYKKTFSYEGSKTTPPDLMMKDGDAIEVKKTESLKSELQLNSSHPKAKLFATSPLINSYCKDCESWTEKDIIYAIGYIPKGTKTLSSLWMIYGSIYAADEKVYTDLKDIVTTSLESIENLNFSETKELGRVNFVDPLKITNMRVRGMWLLKPPVNVFNYVYAYDLDLKFQLIAIVPVEKYITFPEENITKIESLKNTVKIIDVDIKNPNNPVRSIQCKLITIKTP